MTRTATFVALLLVSTSALAWNRLEATRFATLPSDTAHPEGITADAAGNIYVADFDVDHPGPGVVVIFDHSGHVLREVRVAGSTNLLLGLDFTRCPATRGEMLVIDFGGQKVLSVNLSTGASTLFTDLGGGGPNDSRWIGPFGRVIHALLVSPFISQEMGMMMADANHKDLTVLADMMQSGKVKPVIDRTYKLSEVPAAIAYLEEGHARGKVVITLE